MSGSISHSNLLFQNFVWKSIARTVKRFGFLTARAIFPTSYLIYRMENGWTAAESAMILIKTYLNFDIQMHFSLQIDIGWRMVELLPKVLWFLSNLPEFWCRDAFLWFCLIFWHNFWLDGTIGIFWKENTFRIIFLICLIE